MSNDTCNDTCTVCGYWRGLHEYDTMRCPVDQRESGLFRDTVYQEETNELAALRAENEALRKSLKTICDKFDKETYANVKAAVLDARVLLGGEG